MIIFYLKVCQWETSALSKALRNSQCLKILKLRRSQITHNSPKLLNASQAT